MDQQDIQDFRRARLAELLEKKYEGKKVALGRALGHTTGAFVRQLIEGERPITEKTVAQVEALPGCAGWFAMTVNHFSPKAFTTSFENMSVISAEENAAYGFAWAVERIADVLASMPPAQRDRASRLFARMADAPDSRIAREDALQAALGEAPPVPTWRDAAVELVTEIRMSGKPINPETLIRDIDRVHSDRLARVSAKAAQRTMTDS